MQCLYKHLLSQDDGIFTFYWQLVYIFIDIWYSLREECPNTEFFLVRIFLYSVRIQKKTRTRKNSVFGHFSRSDFYIFISWDYDLKSDYWQSYSQALTAKYNGTKIVNEENTALHFSKMLVTPISKKERNAFPKTTELYNF